MKKNNGIQNFFRPYEIGIYVSVGLAVLGVICYFIYFYYGAILIVPGIVGFVLFDSLRVKATEYDRAVGARMEKLRGAGLFEPEDTFCIYARGGAEHFKVGMDGILRTDRYWRTDIRVERSVLRLECYGIDTLSDRVVSEIRCELPVSGLEAELLQGSVVNKNRSYKDTWLQLRTAAGEEYRFPVASNSADSELLLDRIRRFSHAA